MIQFLKNKLKYYQMLFLLLLIGAGSTSFFIQQSKEWKAPPQADKLVNPLSSDPNAIAEGKKLYKSRCAVCHGDKGKGDGMVGASLNPKPTNLLTTSVINETDGAIYWKITTGNSPMPSYKLSLSEPQIWQIVNYIRKLEQNK